MRIMTSKLIGFIQSADDIADSATRRISRNTPLAILSALALAMLLFLPGLYDIPPADRDEPRFTQATKQMIETGDYGDIMFGEEPRYKKPIGIYWLQALAVQLSGPDGLNEIGNYRLVSVLGGLLFVTGVYFLSRRLFGREAAFIAALCAPAPIVVSVEAHLAKTDSVLAATTVFSFYALACAWKAFNLERPDYFQTRHFFIFWLSLALGILVKGVNLAVILLTVIALSAYLRTPRWLSALKPHFGVPLTLLLTAPWFYFIIEKSGGDFVSKSVGEDMLAKLISGVESHKAPPLTHFLAHFGIFFPVALLTPLALITAYKKKAHEGFAFCLLAAAPGWLLFELAPTKLPHYTYPLYGLIFACIGGAIISVMSAPGARMHKGVFYVSAALYLLVSVILSFGTPLGAEMIEAPVSVTLIFLCGCALIITLFNLIAFYKLYFFATLFGLAAQALLLFPYIFGVILPSGGALKPAIRLEQELSRLKCVKNVYLSGYREPSTRFLLGTDLKLIPGEKAAEIYQNADMCDVVLVGEKHQAFRKAHPNLKPQAIVTGVNINGWKPVFVEIYAK